MPTYWRVKPPILGQTQAQVDGFLIIFPSFSHPLPIIFLSCSHHFPILFPSFSHHFPIIFPSSSHHFPIIFPSFSHPLPIIFPSFSHHFPIIFPILFPSFPHHFSHPFPIIPPLYKVVGKKPRTPPGFRRVRPGVVTFAVYAYLRRGLLDAASRRFRVSPWGIRRHRSPVPGLVNIQKAMENHHFQWENPL